MGARGPLPQPDNVRYLRGNPGKRTSKKPVRAKPGVPGMPAWLSAEGKAEWRRVASELDELGTLAKIDRAVLATYCDAWAQFVAARKIVTDDGLLVPGYRGSLVKNPAWQLYRESAALVQALAKDLLTSPAARLRAPTPKGDDDGDDSEDILD